MFQKTLPVTLVAVTVLFAATAMPAGATDQEPDGITALINFDGSIGDLVLVADENGDYTASVSIFQHNDGEWQQVETFATLRVFEDTAPLEGTDRISIGFTSSADAPTTITFSGAEFTGGTLDVFVTFSALGGDPVPTSHHQLAKNAAFAVGDLDLADSFDHHSTRIVAV